jgi:hypothetical protein
VDRVIGRKQETAELLELLGSNRAEFIDELPWMVTPRSKFVMALEGFWNGCACHRHNLMLVVCGSANSWMLDNLVNNHGGLYDSTCWSSA